MPITTVLLVSELFSVQEIGELFHLIIKNLIYRERLWSRTLFISIDASLIEFCRYNLWPLPFGRGAQPTLSQISCKMLLQNATIKFRLEQASCGEREAPEAFYQNSGDTTHNWNHNTTWSVIPFLATPFNWKLTLKFYRDTCFYLAIGIFSEGRRGNGGVIRCSVHQTTVQVDVKPFLKSVAGIETGTYVSVYQ